MAAVAPEAGSPAVSPKAGFPAVTVLVVAAGLALALLPDAAALFVYDRDRVLDGEVWRLVTGHAVHFSWTHAGWNLALLAVAGGWLERAHRAGYLWLLALTALASGLYFLIGLPEMARYGGLSGLVSAAVVTLCLTEMRHGGFVRAIWAAVLLLFAAKVGYEILAGRALFATPDAIPFQVSPAAHIIGAAVAVILFYFSRGGAAAPIQACRSIRRYPRSWRRGQSPDGSDGSASSDGSHGGGSVSPSFLAVDFSCLAARRASFFAAFWRTRSDRSKP